MLHLHNTLTRRKEAFHPLQENQVTLYVCGMTVYDYCHIGNGRMFVVFDMVVRYLRYLGFEVRYVRNITDVDDKIIQRAQQNGEDALVVAERFIQAMRADTQALKLLPPDEEPRVTAYMPAIIALIERLVKADYAYVAENGDVFYAVKRFADYGVFSNQSVEKLRSGARVGILDVKHDPLDFALWKLAKPGEPHWDSPWGKGRPGWHIECSAMSAACLGEHIDIHGGGLDLVFPHHQNEIAQSEAAFGGRFAKYWLHNGYVQMNREKMSKSLGNILTIRDALAHYDAETLRYFLLASHYRSPVNYSADNLDSARAALERWYMCIRGLPAAEVEVSKEAELYVEGFHSAMNDDLNTPLAFAVLFDLAREINRLRDTQPQRAAGLAALLKKLAGVFALLEENPETFLQARTHDGDADAVAVENLIAARTAARRDKQWAQADNLRDQLLALGVVIEDTAQGTVWRRK